jgi:hypothetical protein
MFRQIPEELFGDFSVQFQPLLKHYLRRERDKYVPIFFHLSVFGWQTVISVLKTNNTNIIGEGNHSVLWHSMKILLNFIRQLTSINILFEITREFCFDFRVVYS